MVVGVVLFFLPMILYLYVYILSLYIYSLHRPFLLTEVVRYEVANPLFQRAWISAPTLRARRWPCVM